jgi:hypothetical protein
MKALAERLFRALLTFAVGAASAWVVPAQDNKSSTNREPHFFSKRPWAVGFRMYGTVTNVAWVGAQIQFQVNGRFVFSQFPPEISTPVQIEVHPKGWFSAAVTPDSFVSMTSDGRAGSVQNDKGRLFQILKNAEMRGIAVRFSLVQPKIDFGTNDLGFALVDAKVWQITDADLR